MYIGTKLLYLWMHWTSTGQLNVLRQDTLPFLRLINLSVEDAAIKPSFVRASARNLFVFLSVLLGVGWRCSDVMSQPWVTQGAYSRPHPVICRPWQMQRHFLTGPRWQFCNAETGRSSFGMMEMTRWWQGWRCRRYFGRGVKRRAEHKK